MEKLNALQFVFDDGNVIIRYTDIATGSYLGVDVRVPNPESKCNFTELAAIYDDKSAKSRRFGKSKQTTPTKTFSNLEEVTKFLKEDCKGGNITPHFCNMDDEFILPSCTFTDITDKEILGKEPIPEQKLYRDNIGIWANNGLRIINIKIKNIPNDIKPLNDGCHLELYMRDDIELPPGELFFGNGSRAYPVRDCVWEDEKTINGDIYLNTNEFSKYFKDDSLPSSLFLGYFHIDCDKGISYSFHIKLIVQNTSSLASCKNIRSKHPAFIDFGTSSTCVCVWDSNGSSPRLLSFNNNDKNAFENPTSVIIYRWNNICDKLSFSSSYNCSPVLTAGRYDKGYFDDFFKNNKRVEFDSGHIVRDLLNEGPTDRQLESIIPRIKTIPYELNQKQNERRFFYSYDAPNSRTEIISSIWNNQDVGHINPVMIYGYLLGKMINNALDGCIYTDFKISRPIKFPKEVVDEMRQSLEAGLKLSVPYTLWDKVTVEMSEENLEPVAYIGALIGPRYISIEKGETKPFAVFDFGGGTLDTIFGVLRRDDDGTVIDIYAQGGEQTFGGESLIEKISFYLYSENYLDENSKLRELRVPMLLPVGQLRPANIPDDLTSDSLEAALNLQILGEKYSRHFFEDPNYKSGESTISVELLEKRDDKDDKEKNRQNVELNLNSEKLTDYLYSVIKPRIETFRTEMGYAFKAHLGSDFDCSSVRIFKAGNASRNKTLESIMDTIFAENKVKGNLLMPDASSEKEFSPIYGITPKSAVALGQFYIRRKAINVKIPPYSCKYYIGYEDSGTGKFESVLGKVYIADDWQKWKQVERVPSRPVYTLSYKETLHLNTESCDIDVSDVDYGKYLFIRNVGETEIEYCFADDEPAISVTGSKKLLP